MGKTTNFLLGISLAGLCLFGWNYKKKQEKITGLETKIGKDSLMASFIYDELKKGTAEKLRNNDYFIDSISGLYEKINSENKELKNKYSQVNENLNKIEKEKIELLTEIGKLEALKELKDSGKIRYILDSLEKEIEKKEGEYVNSKKNLDLLNNEIKLRDDKYAVLEKKYKAFMKKPGKLLLDSLEKEIEERDQKYITLEAVYKEEYQKRELEKLVDKNVNSHSSINNYGKEFSLKVKNDKNFFEILFESKRPKLKKIGEKYVVFKDDSPEGMQAFVVDGEGRQNPLKKADNQGIFSYSHINFKDGQYTFYAMDKNGNESPKYVLNISNGIISKKKLD